MRHIYKCDLFKIYFYTNRQNPRLIYGCVLSLSVSNIRENTLNRW